MWGVAPSPKIGWMDGWMEVGWMDGSQISPKFPHEYLVPGSGQLYRRGLFIITVDRYLVLYCTNQVHGIVHQEVYWPLVVLKQAL